MSGKINYSTVTALTEGYSHTDVLVVLISTISAIQKYSVIPEDCILENIRICLEHLQEEDLSEP